MKLRDLFEKITTFFRAPSYSRTLIILGIFLLAIAIPLTVVFLGQKTVTQQSARLLCNDNGSTSETGCGQTGGCTNNYSSHTTVFYDFNLTCSKIDCVSKGQIKGKCNATQSSAGNTCGINSDCVSGTYCARTGKCTNYCKETKTTGVCYGKQVCTLDNAPGGICNSSKYIDCKYVSGKCGYISCPVGEKPNSSNTACVATDCKAAGDTCYTNNSCGSGQHEVSKSCSSSTNAGRICCAAGAPTPWYDCEKNGAMGGNIVKHTPATSVVAHCDSIASCQDPSVNLLFIKDGPDAINQAKAGLCKQAQFTDTVKACIANRMCTDVTVASSIWASINYEISNVLYASCNVLFAPYGPIKDFFCSNATNLRNAVVAKVSSGVINTCLTEIKGATTVIDVGSKAENVCVNACSNIISISSNGFPGPVLLIIGAVRSVLSSAAVPVCRAICPHFATKAAQSALAVCYPGSSITPVSEPGPSNLESSAKNGIASRTCSNQKGKCEATHTDCPSGYTRDLGLDSTCGGTGSNEICCTPNEGGGCTGSDCNSGGGGSTGGGTGGGGNSCTNGQTTQMALNLKLEGIGSGSFENNSPAHTTRPGIYVKVTDQNGTSAYNNTTTTFTYSNTFNAPNVNLGTSLSCGHTYTATVKIPRYLPAKATVAYGKNQTLTLNPIAGDINKVRLSDKVIVGDDKIDVNDYAILRACHNVDPTTPQTFTDNTTTVTVTCADLMNFFDYADGGTQGDEWSFNYNLWVRGYFKANGY